MEAESNVELTNFEMCSSKNMFTYNSEPYFEHSERLPILREPLIISFKLPYCLAAEGNLHHGPELRVLHIRNCVFAIAAISCMERLHLVHLDVIDVRLGDLGLIDFGGFRSSF